MKEKVKKWWIEALESDAYFQNKSKLKVIDPEDGETKYNALGVLCDIFIKKTGNAQWYEAYNESDNNIFAIFDKKRNSSICFLTELIQEWAELEEVPIIDDEPLWKYEEDKTFKEIAIIIKEKL